MKLKVGDLVKAKGNYHDEQLGEHAFTGVQKIVEVLDVPYEGTSGQWVKTNQERDWIDGAWFRKVDHE